MTQTNVELSQSHFSCGWNKKPMSVILPSVNAFSALIKIRYSRFNENLFREGFSQAVLDNTFSQSEKKDRLKSYFCVASA